MTACDAHSDGGLYKVRLSDTVLFPEGGGQPDDRGKASIGNSHPNLIESGFPQGYTQARRTDCSPHGPLQIGDVEVVKVAQESGSVVHYVSSPLEGMIELASRGALSERPRSVRNRSAHRTRIPIILGSRGGGACRD